MNSIIKKCSRCKNKYIEKKDDLCDSCADMEEDINIFNDEEEEYDSDEDGTNIAPHLK